ncbi:hypothetical protein APR04_003095 [Promicromonospora umidemergens]|uniref:LysE type translocator n=1 Tax=Promicromonospora umidemergens TaxID=629679 RepID=A0ABP8Y116_9MICO|nr:hypothetical protein [Promicromonospora umidemergens]MCP2284175.1 hypothetical protein [Promicromonospora umidemergens]
MVHIAGCAVVYLLAGYGARRVLTTRPTAVRVVTRASGAAMILIGSLLIVEKVLM